MLAIPVIWSVPLASAALPTLWLPKRLMKPLPASAETAAETATPRDLHVTAGTAGSDTYIMKSILEPTQKNKKRLITVSLS